MTTQRQRIRKSAIKRLKICPVCAGYMQAGTAISGPQVGKRSWQDDTVHRSFGGHQLRVFECEKCHHQETFQVDELDYLREDEDS